MNEETKMILIAILNLIAETRGPQPVTDQEFFKHDQLIRDLIEQAAARGRGGRNEA